MRFTALFCLGLSPLQAYSIHINIQHPLPITLNPNPSGQCFNRRRDHILSNLIINALLDANADRKLGKSPKYTDSEWLKIPKTIKKMKGLSA